MNIPYYYVPKVQKFLQDKSDYNDVLVASSYTGRLLQILKKLKNQKQKGR